MQKKGAEEHEEPLLPIHKGGEQHGTGDGVSHAASLPGQKTPSALDSSLPQEDTLSVFT